MLLHARPQLSRKEYNALVRLAWEMEKIITSYR
jgi:hypothetical protein